MGTISTRLMAGAALLALTACSEPFDFDLRDLGNGFDTTQAVQNVARRPAPDNRGVISYPNYQVVVARRGDTVASVASRIGVDATSLARYNGLTPETPLNRDGILALPARVAEPSPATGATSTGPIQPPSSVNVTELASNAIDRAEATTPAPTAAAPANGQTGFEPIRHQVQRGETIYSIGRNYDIPVRSIAEWNGLGTDLAVREGQFLLIPMAVPDTSNGTVVTPAAVVPEPGTGTPTPVPPSASTALPDEAPEATTNTAATTTAPPAPDLGTQSASSADARFQYPVRGSIIRDYARGRNEGIDIAVPAGTPVQAAGAGTVAAITSNTDGASIIVLRHSDNLLTVYVNLEDLTVEKGDRVSAGQTLAKVPAGDPSFLHFEVREGLEARDPNDYLP